MRSIALSIFIGCASCCFMSNANYTKLLTSGSDCEGFILRRVCVGNLRTQEVTVTVSYGRCTLRDLNDHGIDGVNADAFINQNRITTLNMDKNQIQHLPATVLDDLINVQDL
eukprot:gb/GECG01001676.1/.p1 GENE.gb/GECG01001676.1/~~gb/GECG01001676.1/.p1  ORF type:complete len:112 (+),score=4.00 gb/GECG01001676.1/:1-336(+)